MDYAPRYEFQKCVARYRGDYQQKGFSCWDQFLAMAFAQLIYRESLRDIEACLRALGRKRYHMGFRSKVARTTLADANERRDWRIYADFAQVLIGMARPLYAEDPIGVELDQGLYALDSTTIDLCLSLFPWARFRRHKAGKCANLSWKLKRLQTLWFYGIGRNNIKPVRERSRDEESVTFGEKTQEEASTG